MDKCYNWQLIEFTDCTTAEGVPYVDCVPAAWVTYNAKNNNLLVYYPAPPYDNNILHLLQEKIKNKKHPEKNWPLWNIDIRGGASKIQFLINNSLTSTIIFSFFPDTYRTAMKRLTKLKNNNLVFTTDTEISARNQKDHQVQHYKTTNLKEIMDVPKMTSDRTTNSNNGKYTNNRII